MLAERSPEDPIRVWSAGCASGQEAYTLAMLLAESLDPDNFRQRVKIYATDVDEDALSEARAATYDAKAVESVPPELVEKYFDQLNGRYIFHKDLRRAVIFGRNDLVKDAPISRVDLLVCRSLRRVVMRIAPAVPGEHGGLLVSGCSTPVCCAGVEVSLRGGAVRAHGPLQ